MFQALKPTLLTKYDTLYCPACKEVFHDYIGDANESFPFPLKLDVPRRRLANNRKIVSVQQLWDLEAIREEVFSLQFHEKCKAEKIRIKETFVQDPMENNSGDFFC